MFFTKFLGLTLLASGCMWLSAAALENGAATQLTVTSSLQSVIRLRANRVRRPEFCRENLPRKSEELPVLVITGKIKEVYGDPIPTIQQQQNQTNEKLPDKALVNVLRVIKGNPQLVNADIVIQGFNSNASCMNYIRPNDSYILLLNQDSLDQRKFSIQGNNLLNMNLNNLDRINQIASDEPFKRRGPIEDILCEAHYCPYGRCQVINADLKQLTCHCPDSCSALPAPVCGSDNTTYTNECHLIREGCRRQRPLFVTKEASC